MCGIVGYVGDKPCQELLIDALEKLEYRGYDSAGLSLITQGHIERVRATGNLAQLREEISRRPTNGNKEATTGIGHTRWATHGSVTKENAHPHSDNKGTIHIALNGIIENYLELQERLASTGASFSSDTDAEVVAHLVAHFYHGDLIEAVSKARDLLRGHFAFVVIAADSPQLLVAARKECPLIVGTGQGEQFVASATPAFLRYTKQVQLVEDDEVVAITPEGTRFFSATGKETTREAKSVEEVDDDISRGGYETFMLKEIHEQPQAIAKTIGDSLRSNNISLPGFEMTDAQLRKINRIIIVACGTSYHAGLMGRCALERWARLPVEFDIASEFCYHEPVLGPNDLVIGITQSGETADTLSAMRFAQKHGAQVISVTNVQSSQATRTADAVLLTRAGLEIGVAATKTFTAQVTAMYMLSLKLAQVRESIPNKELTEIRAELELLPSLTAQVLANTEAQIRGLAERFSGDSFFLYLGRYVGLPVALEGALKLKEVSYIAADAYAAGEMKHGPIAMLSNWTPVVCVATDSPALEKVLSNISEVRARGARVIVVATEGATHVNGNEDVVYVPQTNWLMQSLLAVVPLQLFAYHVACNRGLNVDQPRNLAKTVTVE